MFGEHSTTGVKKVTQQGQKGLKRGRKGSGKEEELGSNKRKEERQRTDGDKVQKGHGQEVLPLWRCWWSLVAAAPSTGSQCNLQVAAENHTRINSS